MKPIFTLGLLCSLVFSACSETQNPEAGETTAILRNYTGLDGCGWVLEIADNKILEPTNLTNFPITLSEGKTVYITYQSTPAGSICMVGEIVEILTLKESRP